MRKIFVFKPVQTTMSKLKPGDIFIIKDKNPQHEINQYIYVAKNRPNRTNKDTRELQINVNILKEYGEHE